MEIILEKTNKLDVEEFFAKFPHLEKRISFQWGTQECRDFMMSLTGFFEPTGDRKSRQGFSKADLSTILQLIARHDALFPQFDKDDPDAPFSSFSSYSDFEEKRPTKSKFMEYQEQQKQQRKIDWSGTIWLIIIIAIAAAFFHYK